MTKSSAPALLHNLLDLSDELLLGLNLDRQLRETNSAFQQAVGFDDSTLRGQSLLTFIADEDRALCDDQLDRVFSLGAPVEFSCRLTTTHGSTIVRWRWRVNVSQQAFLGRGVLDGGTKLASDGAFGDWASLMAHVDDVVLLVDRNGAIAFASPGLKKLLGLSSDDAVGATLPSLVAPNESAKLKTMLQTATKRRDFVQIGTFNYHVRGGGALTCETVLVNPRPNVGGIVVTLKRRKLRTSGIEPLRNTVSPAISTWVWDVSTDTVHVSDGCRSALGLRTSERQMVFPEWLQRIHPDERPNLEVQLRALVRGDFERAESHHRVLHADGVHRWLYHDLHRQFDATGDTTSVKANVCGPASERGVDTLTGLPNRNYITGKLQHALATLRERPDFRFAVMSIDLDRFKTVNDSLGRRFGDELLQLVSQRIRSCLAPADVLARFGADEFGVLMENLRDHDEARRVAERIQNALAHPFPVGGKPVFSSASIGIAPSDRSYPDPEEILRAAKLAMRTSKREPKRTPATFRTEMSMQAINLFNLAADLRVAVQNGELALHYQPIINIETQTILGFEALVRWNHPRRGLLRPDTFIPFAEEEGLIAPISWWVIEAACTQLNEWHRTVPELSQALVTVNLSGKLFEGSGLVERMDDILERTQVRRSSVLLEITESTMMQNPEQTCDILNQLRSRGMLIAVDDFGTGYSSLSYLFQFPVTGLKIDKSFVSQMVGPATSMEVVRTILMLARNLKMFVIAEGVETDLHLSLLRELECKLAQGYFFAKPMSAIDVDGWLERRRATV